MEEQNLQTDLEVSGTRRRKLKIVASIIFIIAIGALVFSLMNKQSQEEVLTDKEAKVQARLEQMQNKGKVKDKDIDPAADPAPSNIGDNNDNNANVVTGAVSASESCDVDTKKDVTYSTTGGVTLKMDIYTPDIDAPTPAVVFIHGGGFKGGSKEGVADESLMLAKHCVAVVAVDYRLSGVAKFPAQINDVKGAVRFVRANSYSYNIDPNKIFSLGESAGGVLASLLGVTGNYPSLEGNIGGNTSYSSEVSGVINISGSYVASIIDTMANGIKNSISNEVGCSPVPSTECKDEYEALSPETYIDTGDSPFIILHGDKDKSVPEVQAETLNEILNDEGVPSEIYVGAGFGHVGGLLEHFMSSVVSFLNTNI